MNKKYQFIAVAMVLCGILAAAPVQAASNIVDDSQINIAPPGPEADLYLQHYHGNSDARRIDPYWHIVVLNGKNPAEVSVAPPGPEADLYLQHYHSTPLRRPAAAVLRPQARVVADLIEDVSFLGQPILNHPAVHVSGAAQLIRAGERFVPEASLYLSAHVDQESGASQMIRAADGANVFIPEASLYLGEWMPRVAYSVSE